MYLRTCHTPQCIRKVPPCTLRDFAQNSAAAERNIAVNLNDLLILLHHYFPEVRAGGSFHFQQVGAGSKIIYVHLFFSW